MLYMHVKRQTLYEILDEEFHLTIFSKEGAVFPFTHEGQVYDAELQFSGEGVYAGPVVIYRGLDNKVWMRPTFEFYDGRFKQVCSGTS